MCFVHDYDWTWATWIQENRTAQTPLKCIECKQPINQGDEFQYLEAWESDYPENCMACHNSECECCDCDNGMECCSCEEPETGEHFQADMCLGCVKFRKAVHDVEIEEGCSEYESEPSYCEMFFECRENGKRSCAKYLRRLRKDYPETVASGYFQFAVGKLL